MKVVHINTHDTGGAAIAAYRLHQGLLANGVDSSFLVLYNSHQYKDTITFKPKWYHFLFKKIIRRIKNYSRLPKQIDNRIEIFSSPDTVYDILTSPVVRQSDIIHLHWVANFIDYETFFRKTKKKIIWTFHDLNPILGGFHYNLDKSYATSILLAIDQGYLELKLKSIEKSNSITVISPSFWLKSEIEKSPFKMVFEKCNVIHYGIDSLRHSIIDRIHARKSLVLDLGKTIILVIATNLQNYRKGFDMVLKVIDKLKTDGNTEFLLVGELEEIPSSSNIKYIGPVKDFTKLNLIYNAVDGVMLSSREDNLPNVMLEALICGTPVLGFAVGGVKDVISNLNGVTTEIISSEALLSNTRHFIDIKETFDRERIRENAVRGFDLANQNVKVTNLYKMVINDSCK